MDGNHLCVGAGNLDSPPKTSRGLGRRPLGASVQRLGMGSRPLAVNAERPTLNSQRPIP
jgi:hypothetical protein